MASFPFLLPLYPCTSLFQWLTLLPCEKQHKHWHPSTYQTTWHQQKTASSCSLSWGSHNLQVLRYLEIFYSVLIFIFFRSYTDSLSFFFWSSEQLFNYSAIINYLVITETVVIFVFIVCILLCVIHRIYDIYSKDSLHNNISERITKYTLMCTSAVQHWLHRYDTSQWDVITQNIKTTKNYIPSSTSNPLEQYTAYEIIPHTAIGRANQHGFVKKISMYKHPQKHNCFYYLNSTLIRSGDKVLWSL
jgi:hypothetical protein